MSLTQRAAFFCLKKSRIKPLNRFVLVPASLILCTLLAPLPCVAQGLLSPIGPLAKDRPNIVLYIVDQLAVDSQIASDADLEPGSMPSIVELCRNGLTFSHVYTASPDPVSSNQIFYRGMFPRWDHELEELSTTLQSSQQSAGDSRNLTSHLRSLGYRLLQIGESPEIETQQFAPESIMSLAQWHRDNRTTKNGASNFVALLSETLRAEGRPICLFIHDTLSIDGDGLAAPQAMAALDRRLATATTAANAIFDKNRTLFLFTSLRGSGNHEAGEHLRDEALRVPLVVSWPENIAPGGRSDAMISTVDFLPTLIELAGGTPPGDSDGFSFAGIIRGEEIDHRDIVFAVDPQSNGNVFCIRDRRFKLVQAWNANPSERGETNAAEEMYDLSADPGEQRNLMSVKNYQGRRQEYRSQLLTWLYRLGIRLRR